MNRTVVGAHYGFRDWLVQRVTAVVMALYTLFMFLALPLGAGSYESWRRLMANGFIRFATFLFIVSLCYHAWIGVRNIWMDYVKNTGLRLLLQVATVLWLVGCGGWAVQVLWRA